MCDCDRKFHGVFMYLALFDGLSGALSLPFPVTVLISMRVMSLSTVTKNMHNATFGISNWCHAAHKLRNVLLDPGRRGISFQSSPKSGRILARDREGELPWVAVDKVAVTHDVPFNSSIKIIEEGGVQWYDFRCVSNSVIVAYSPRSAY